MATNTINQILQKEKQADENIAAAKQAASLAVENAKTKAEQLREQILSDARKKAEELTAKVQLDVDKMYDDAKAEAEKRKEQIISSSSSVKSKATEIVREILF